LARELNQTRILMAESMQSDVQLVERLRQHVDVLAELIGPRHVGRPKALESAATYVERQFLALGDEVERQTYDVESTTVANLVVERSGERSPDSTRTITRVPTEQTLSTTIGWHKWRAAWPEG
jgi:hypothetical protein